MQSTKTIAQLRRHKVYKRLKQMPGADVFRRQDIPEEYHYKKGRYVQEILVVAKKGWPINNRPNQP